MVGAKPLPGCDWLHKEGACLADDIVGAAEESAGEPINILPPSENLAVHKRRHIQAKRLGEHTRRSITSIRREQETRFRKIRKKHVPRQWPTEEYARRAGELAVRLSYY